MLSSRLSLSKASNLITRCPKKSLPPRRDVLQQLSYLPLSTSCTCYKFETALRARMMKKLITGSNRSRKKFYTVEQPVSNSFAEFDFKGKGSSSQKAVPVSGKVKRRLEVLNALFIEQITGLLATGEVSPEFMGLGIQISKVKVTPNFSAVNVYWYASGTEKDEVINQVLTKASGHLRHELSQLRVIGIVPPIQFFPDKTFSKFQEVETLLNKLDLGPGFEPTPASVSLGGQPPSSKKDALNSDAEVSQPESEVEEVMRHDMLGVRHDKIMNEITKAVQKQRDRKAAKANQQVLIRSISDECDDGGPQKIENAESTLAESEGTDTDLQVENFRARQREFLKYLQKRQAEKAKEMRRLSVEQMEKDWLLSEAEDRWRTAVEERVRLIDESIDYNEDDTHNDDEEEYYQNLRQNFRDDSYNHQP